MGHNGKKSSQLGMPIGTAQGRLRKMVMFALIQRLGEDFCYRCDKRIEMIDDLSIEHKKPWLDVGVELFWDLNNIAFSHLGCNAGAARTRPRQHGKQWTYVNGCRCDDCVASNTEMVQRHRGRKVLQAAID